MTGGTLLACDDDAGQNATPQAHQPIVENEGHGVSQHLHRIGEVCVIAVSCKGDQVSAGSQYEQIMRES